MRKSGNGQGVFIRSWPDTEKPARLNLADGTHSEQKRSLVFRWVAIASPHRAGRTQPQTLLGSTDPASPSAAGVRRRNRFTRPWSFRAAEVPSSPESDQRVPAFTLGLMKRRVIDGGGSTRSCYRAGGISIAAMVHSYWANRPIGRLGGNVLGGIGGAVVAGMDDRRTCTVIPGSISMNRPASCPASR